MPRPNNTLAIPAGARRLRLVVDADLVPALDRAAAELGLSTSSACRLVVEMFAKGQISPHAIRAELGARAAGVLKGPAAHPGPASGRKRGRPRRTA